MPLYTYECVEHGSFDKIGSIHDEVEFCPQCRKVVKKLPVLFAVDRKSKMGHTRMELFDNLAKEGNGQKEWREYDSYYKRAKYGVDED